MKPKEITVLLCHNSLYDPILKEAQVYWSQIGTELITYTDKEAVENILKHIKTDWYIQSDSAWRVVGRFEPTPRESDVVFVESIEHHRLDATKRRIPWLRNTKTNNAGKQKVLITQFKVYNTIGKGIKKKLNSQLKLKTSKSYFCVLQGLKNGDYNYDWSNLNKMNETQKLTLLEYILVHNYEYYAAHRELFTRKLNTIRLPQKLLMQGMLDFFKKDFLSARSKLLEYLNLDKLHLDYNYEYDIYIREYAPLSFLFRIEMILDNIHKIEEYGRQQFYICPYKKAYEANRYLLRNYMIIKSITYENIEAMPRSSSSKPKTKFIIYSQPRSGSTLLTQELNSHPEVSSLGELLSGEECLDMLNLGQYQFEYIAKRELDAAQLYYDTTDQAKTPVSGMKVLGTQMNLYPHQDLWHKLISKRPKIIYLYRENKDKQASSLGLAFQNEHFRAHPNFRIYDTLETIEPYKEAVSVFENEDKSYLDVAKNTGCEVYSLSFEDYLSNKQQHQRNICDFLGVSYVLMSSNTRKQNIWPSESLTKNN